MKCSASSLLNKNNYDSGKLVTAYFPVTFDLPGKGGGGGKRRGKRRGERRGGKRRGERRGKFTIYINAEKR